MNGFISAGGEKKKGQDPLIKFVIQPQQHVIIPIHSYAFVHCQANYTKLPSKQQSDVDYENDDPMINDYLPSDDDFQQNDAPTDDLLGQINDSHETQTTNQCPQEIQYQWLQNDTPIDTDPDNSFVETFCNGTIKIKHTFKATGIYRCIASTMIRDDGAIISNAANVQAAGRF